MATRTVMTSTINATPDHLHVFQYTSGDQYLIGSPHMPQALSTKLVALSVATEDSTAVAAAQTTKHNKEKVALVDIDGPEMLPW